MTASNRGIECGVYWDNEELADELAHRLRLFSGVTVTRVSSVEEAKCLDVVFGGVTEVLALQGCRVRVVAVGRRLTAAAIERVLAASAEEYLAYPFLLKSLRDCLRRRPLPNPYNGLHQIYGRARSIENHAFSML